MEQGQTYSHRPVLLDECIEGLRIRPGGLYLDGTLGRAGHSREIARRLDTGRLVCIDRDQAALDAAQDRLAGCLDKVELIHGNFGDLAELLDGRGLGPFDGMLFDLGVSSPQLDDPERGFSYMHDAPLDMRMDRSEALTAAIVVNEWPQEELKRILWQYGEERYAPQIAGAIARRRRTSPSAPRWSWWRSSAAPCPPRPCGRSSTRPSAAFRPSGSRSMTSWRRWTGCSRQRCPGCPQGDGWRSSPSTPWRTAS